MIEVMGSRRRSSQPPDPPPDPDPVDPSPDVSRPYPMPTGEPYNVWIYAITPTPDQTGSTVHPSVLDFQQINGGTWNGWRYWMAHTPFYDGNSQIENPSIIVSQNGYHWHEPEGITNPLYPVQPNSFNSDVTLEYDTEGDRLFLLWCERDYDGIPAQIRRYAMSGQDGVTWPANPATLDYTFVRDGGGSPAVVRRGPNDWWMFSQDFAEYDAMAIRLYSWKATNPEGTWDGPYDLGKPPIGDLWHLDVIWHDGAFRILADLGRYTNAPDTYLPGTTDGITPATWASIGLMSRPATPAWDSTQLYRASFTPHEDGIHYRVWYSADGPSSWRVGLTQFPQSAWPTPPTP